MGSLYVYSDNDTDGNYDYLWHQTYSQLAKWHFVKLTINYFGGFVRFKAFRGNGQKSDVAIDDITINSGACTGTDVSTLPFECNFEDDFCMFKQDDVNDHNDWIRLKGPTPSRPDTGPPFDHTFENATGLLKRLNNLHFSLF